MFNATELFAGVLEGNMFYHIMLEAQIEANGVGTAKKLVVYVLPQITGYRLKYPSSYHYGINKKVG